MILGWIAPARCRSADLTDCGLGSATGIIRGPVPVARASSGSTP
jgi:hypothetical protein